MEERKSVRLDWLSSSCGETRRDETQRGASREEEREGEGVNAATAPAAAAAVAVDTERRCGGREGEALCGFGVNGGAAESESTVLRPDRHRTRSVCR